MPEHLCVSECNGCAKADDPHVPDTLLCRSYEFPESKWLNGKRCPLCTVPKMVEKKKEVFIDPIKKSKQAMKGK